MSTQSISKITMDTTSASVWQALTDPALVKQWQYGTELVTDWRIGSPILFRNVWEGTIYEQKGTILEVEPNRRVKYTLFAPRPGLDDLPGNYFTMTYSLEEVNGKTTLTIIQDDPREQASQEPADDDTGNAILNGLKKLVEG